MNTRTRIRHNRRGSNQYQLKRAFSEEAKFYLTLFLVASLIWFVLIAIAHSKFHERFQPVTDPIMSPLAMRAYAMEIVDPLETSKVVVDTPTKKEIADYIREVFGEHADKAFAVLSCENASLNPKAVNTAGNVPAGSRDIGVFQINEYWQGVNGKFLFNWKINVQIAHQIYTDNGNSFERWTCGRKLGV